MGNMLRELLRLHETANDTKRYIQHDIHVTDINMFIDKNWLSECKHCDNVVTNANSEIARSRMEASSEGKRECGGKGRWI
jgi:hypothetical protein